MDLFEQLNQIDSIVCDEEDKKVQQALFLEKKVEGSFFDEDLVWQEIELEKAQQAEKEKLKPLTAGFGPWSW